MLRFFLRRRARRLDQYWQALSGYDAPPAPPPAPPPGLPSDLAEQTRWLHSVSQAISPVSSTPPTVPGSPMSAPPARSASVTPTPACPAAASRGAGNGSLLLAVLVVCGLIVAATQMRGGSQADATSPLPTAPVDADNPFLGASMPPEVHNLINAMVTHVTISDTAQGIDVAVTANAVWVATTAEWDPDAGSTESQALLYRVPFDTFTGVQFRASTPTATLQPSPPITFAGDIGHILAAYGSLWVAGVSQTGEGRLLRMDPDSGEILNEYTVDTWPGDVIAADDAVWFGGYLEPRIWRVSSDGADLQTIDVAEPDGSLAHIPSGSPGAPGLWYLARAGQTADGPAITFARLVGSHAIDPTRSDAATCAPVGSTHDGVSDAERERPLAFTECRLWVMGEYAAVSIYPLESGAQPERTLDFDGHVGQILPDGEHVYVVVSEPSTGKYPNMVLYTIGPDDAYEREQFDEMRPGSLAYVGQMDSWSAQHWLWIVTGRVKRGTELIARPRPDGPSPPPEYEPTATSAVPYEPASPVAAP